MIRNSAVVAAFCILFNCPAGADDEALAIIEKAFEAARANEAIARRYVYEERIEERRLNKKGEEKKRESNTYDVTLLDNSEFRRLIARNDLPLDDKTAAKENKRVEKRIRKMQSETPKQRKKRLAQVEKSRDEGEEFLEEITRAFDFRLTGEEVIDGEATHVITAEPREGYEPSSREANVLTGLRGTLWISKESYAWVKADMETFADITWGILFKLREGAKIQFTQRRLNDEVWLPDRWYVRIRARAALVYKFNGEVNGSYSNYRRFSTAATDVHGDAAR